MKKSFIAGLSALAVACSDDPYKVQETELKDPHPRPYPISQEIQAVQSPYICKIEGFQTGRKTKASVERSFSAEDITHVQGHKANEIEDGVLSVFYTTNSWKLMSNDIDDLRKFGRTLNNDASLIIEGRADYRGTEERNAVLGRNRAEGVAEFLQTYTRGNVDFVSYGENDASQDTDDKEQLARDRVVRIVPNRGLVTRALEVSPADVYLIDQSGSMHGEKWAQVQAFSFPKDAEVYTFESPRQDCSIPLVQRFPSGGTPLYVSLSDVLVSMKDSQTLTVLTDGDDTSGERTPFDVISLAKRKDISVNVIGLGVSRPENLEQIASETGGQAYIRQ